MPALSVPDVTALTRLTLKKGPTADRPVISVTSGTRDVEGAGFPVYRGFAGLQTFQTDPFVLLDQAGPVNNGPYETKGAPWHPHRGFETVTYLLDGGIVHKDSNGGGGIIAEGDTQWMTAGAGVLHDELPTEQVLNTGGMQHAIQLWVNLPGSLKSTPPRYQTVRAGSYALLASPDAGAFVRLIAGEIDGHSGPGSTHTPITLTHVTIAPGAQITIPWDPTHSAMVYVLDGQGSVGIHGHPVGAHQMALLGEGDTVTVSAESKQQSATGSLEALILGGRPIREPVIQYGPFVMNTEAEIRQAVEDFQAGRLGTIPADVA